MKYLRRSVGAEKKENTPHMKRKRIIPLLLALVLFFSAFAPTVIAADEAVAAVISQLEAIDSLAQMQAKRANYNASLVFSPKKAMDAPDNVAALEQHAEKRAAYMAYLSDMFAARTAAELAYNALTEAQKAQIDPALVQKLTDSLGTVFPYSKYVRAQGVPVTLSPRSDEYRYELHGTYESSNYLTQGYEEGQPDVPATIILVDSRESSPWTPDGLYSYGQNNYEVTYCSDLITLPVRGTHYKRTNLEDSGHYSAGAARHIRAIMEIAYPYLTVDEMKAELVSRGLDADFVAGLNRSHLIAGVQMAIWAYSNMDLDRIQYVARYGGTYNSALVSYMNPAHDFNNELWEWWPTTAGRMTYDAETAYAVNNLVWFLCNLEPKSAATPQLVISDVEVAMADLVPGQNDLYELGLYVSLNGEVKEGDVVAITVRTVNENGETTDSRTLGAAPGSSFPMTVRARAGDTVIVEINGTQYLERGVYFYEPEGGRDASQTLVGIADGLTPVHAETEFTFARDIEKGLRIYKTTTEGDLPLSDIVFDVYRVPEAVNVSEAPTEEEVSRYAVNENLIGTVTTDTTGYANLAIPDDGVYIVVERPNAKVKAPASPFWFTLPMPVAIPDPDGESETDTVITYTDVAAVYPKNEPVPPPDIPPDIPPPDDSVKGRFRIVKYAEFDETRLLSGAEFLVCRAAAASDDESSVRVVTVNGVSMAVVPVTVDGANLTLTTDENGEALSPELSCGRYYLIETKAPAGYELPEEAFSVTVVQTLTNTVADLRVPNTYGVELPSTGGAGTPLLYCAGALLICGAAVLAITPLFRKKHKTDGSLS